MEAILKLEMPKDCYECRFCVEEESFGKRVFVCKAYESEIEDLSSRAEWCPLRPILGDSDEQSR